MGWRLEIIIDEIYEAAAMPERWPSVLHRLGSLLGAKGGLLFSTSTEGVRWLGSDGVAEIMADFLAAGWMAHNDRIPILIQRAHPGFLTDTDCYTEEQIAAHPMYTEFLWPRGIFAAAATLIRGAGEDGLVLSIEGYPSHQAARASVAMLDTLRPHLARAAMLASQFRLQRWRAALDGLHAVGVAAAVVSVRGQLNAANALFDAAIGAGVVDLPSGMRLADEAADQLFRDTLDRIRLGMADGRSIPLRPTGGAPAQVLHILPLMGDARDLFSEGLVIVVLSTAGGPSLLGHDLLQGLFDLTPAEARVARALAEGKSLGAIAASSGVSPHTVRTQMRAIFAKTGVSRQVDLVSMMSMLAVPGPAMAAAG